MAARAPQAAGLGARRVMAAAVLAGPRLAAATRTQPSAALGGGGAAAASGGATTGGVWRWCCPSSSSQASAPFSTSAALAKRRKRYHPRDNNRLRGVSSVRRSGPREHLSVSDAPLPRPVAQEGGGGGSERVARPAIDPAHGLWQFFYDGQVAQAPTRDAAFGRSWTAEELRRKSWDDLHRLWWVCVKERNRIATATVARKHFNLGFGDHEAQERDAAVRQTMRGIKHVLTERFYAWEDAVDLARSDPEIDLSGDGPAFRPATYLEEEPQPQLHAGEIAAGPDAAAADAPAAPETAAETAAPPAGQARAEPLPVR